MGIIDANRGRIDGRQAQMMPMLTSIAESTAALRLSKVGSVEAEMETRNLRRMMEMRQTLETVSI